MDKQKLNNFLITGFGRSGTMFLSQIMNQSKKWTVLHEPRGDEDETRIFPTPTAVEDWNKDYYGEVNSRMRFNFYDVDVAKRGLLLRKPKDIILSASNRNTIQRSVELVEEVNEWYTTFAEWIAKDDNLLLIQFKGITTNKEYLETVLKYFGITDVNMDTINLTKKVNDNFNTPYPTWELLPKVIKEKYDKCKWE